MGMYIIVKRNIANTSQKSHGMMVNYLLHTARPPMQFVTGSLQPATSTTLCSSVSVLNLIKRLEITLNFCAVVMHVSMLDQTLEDDVRVLAGLVMEEREVQVVVTKSEEAIDWDFGRGKVVDIMAD
jgi:hypothetical protein